jgi:predicted nucleotidyltransferase
MNDIENYVLRVAEFFKANLGADLVEAYKLGSLAHGGFSDAYSDIDVGLVLRCHEPPKGMSELIAGAKALDAEYGKKLSMFWGNPELDWGRLPVIDRLDLLDHGVALLHGFKPKLRRPTRDEIHQEQLHSVERSWKPRLPELNGLTRLEAKDRKPYIRAILYAARLIYTWDNVVVGSNDTAVEYLHQARPDGLDLKPIDMALACRNGDCGADDVLRLDSDLNRQCESAMRHVLAQG